MSGGEDMKAVEAEIDAVACDDPGERAPRGRRPDYRCAEDNKRRAGRAEQPRAASGRQCPWRRPRLRLHLAADANRGRGLVEGYVGGGDDATGDDVRRSFTPWARPIGSAFSLKLRSAGISLP